MRRELASKVGRDPHSIKRNQITCTVSWHKAARRDSCFRSTRTIMSKYCRYIVDILLVCIFFLANRFAERFHHPGRAGWSFLYILSHSVCRVSLTTLCRVVFLHFLANRFARAVSPPWTCRVVLFLFSWPIGSPERLSHPGRAGWHFLHLLSHSGELSGSTLDVQGAIFFIFLATRLAYHPRNTGWTILCLFFIYYIS